MDLRFRDKKVPLLIVPTILVILFFCSFLFLPPDADLVSPKGDYYIGQILGILFPVCFVIDWYRFFGKKKK